MRRWSVNSATSYIDPSVYHLQGWLLITIADDVDVPMMQIHNHELSVRLVATPSQQPHSKDTLAGYLTCIVSSCLLYFANKQLTFSLPRYLHLNGIYACAQIDKIEELERADAMLKQPMYPGKLHTLPLMCWARASTPAMPSVKPDTTCPL